MDADGTNERPLIVQDEDQRYPAFSPDGTRIAFEQHDPGVSTNGDIFILELGSGDVTRLTDDPAHDEGPAWSPDGSMIAFTSQRADPKGDIWVMLADGGEQRRLTTNSILDESPDWQPIPTSLADRVPCGDTIVTDNPRHCERARRITAVEPPFCTSAWHSFDQTLVECGNDAFVRRG